MIGSAQRKESGLFAAFPARKLVGEFEGDLHSSRAVVGEESFAEIRRDFSISQTRLIRKLYELPCQQRSGLVCEAECGGVGDLLKLLVHGGIDPGMVVAVQVGPD